MRVFSRVASVLFFVIVSSLLASTAAAAPDAAPDDTALIKRAIQLTNEERMRAGLNPLQWNDQLAASATAYAREMAARGFFAHNSPEGITPVDRARNAGYPAYGWGGLYVGENLARGYDSAESVHQGWMNSESHKQNLLHPKYREIGIGVAVAPNGTRYWAQEFGSRPNVLPVFINGDAGATDSARVTLTLTDEQVSPWGSLSPIASVMVSNRPDFAGAAWEPFAATRSWTLQGQPGSQAVYVRVRDTRGQVVEARDEIQYVGRVALALDEPQAVEEPAVNLAVAGDMPGQEAPVEGATTEDPASGEATQEQQAENAANETVVDA